ncbi:tryptophanase leader peptide [Vibrio sp. HN007]
MNIDQSQSFWYNLDYKIACFFPSR